MAAGTLGILLAGGRGTRLGLGAPKALAPFAGGTLLSHALATLRAVCDDVVVCAPDFLVLPVPDEMRADDPPGAAGPLAGLVAGLASRPFARALALGVDLPFAGARLLRALGELLGEPSRESPGGSLAWPVAVVPAPGGWLQPLAAWYAPASLAPLAAALARGARALVPAVSALAPRIVDDAALGALGVGPRTFLNVNTPADLAEAALEAGRGGRA